MKMNQVMRSLFWVLIALGLLQPAVAAELSFLKAQGHDMVNANGKKILLRGVGLGNYMLPEGYMWKFGKDADRPRRIEKIVSDLIGPAEATKFWKEFRAGYVTEQDIARISELGYNSVRPALNSRLFLTETTPPQYINEGFELLDNLVGWCRKHRIYVIIDMHGAPGGQTGQNIDDSLDDEPRLFMDAKYQDQLVDLWKKIAARYKDEATVAGYDLLNEPLPARTGAAGKYKALVEPLYQRITSAIREVDSRHMIIMEGVDWANDWSIFSASFDPNTCYQFHYYCWDQPSVRKSIKTYLDYRQKLNAPVWVGETGEKDDRIYWATMDYFEANNIGWSFWPWKKMDTRNTPYSIRPPKNWSMVQEYTRGGPKPEPQIARAAFNELLENLKLNNCQFYPEVVNAMFRRIPGRIEAENFGAEGPGRSFSVKDSSRNSPFYRLEEPVRIEQVQSEGRGQEFAVALSSGEWTAYNIEVQQPASYLFTVRAKGLGAPAVLRVLNSDGQGEKVTVGPDAFIEAKGTLKLTKGRARIKILIDEGAALVDWLELRR